MTCYVAADVTVRWRHTRHTASKLLHNGDRALESGHHIAHTQASAHLSCAVFAALVRDVL